MQQKNTDLDDNTGCPPNTIVLYITFHTLRRKRKKIPGLKVLSCVLGELGLKLIFHRTAHFKNMNAFEVLIAVFTYQ